eukprot:gene38184-46396_t
MPRKNLVVDYDDSSKESYTPLVLDIPALGIAQGKLTLSSPDVSDITSVADKYVSVQKYRKSTPMVAWEPLSPIDWPEPITEDAHHRANAHDYRGRPVHGKFFFAPPAGTVFEAGFHMLELTFIPDKAEKYQGVHLTKEIEVRKKRPIVTWDNVTLERNYLQPLGDEVF